MKGTPRRLLVTRRLPDAVEARLARSYAVTFNPSDAPLDHSALVRAMRDHDALLPTITDRIDSGLLSDPARRVRVIANFGAGHEHIDLAAARAAGVPISNTPGALTEATAELAITLMLMAARRTGEGERELRRGGWSGWHPTHLLGRTLVGCTLGLVGFGRIAKATARRARALGMHIAYHSRRQVSAEDELEAHWMESLEALAEASDILSVHVPGGAETHHLIDARIFARMRPDAILINTARGPVVDERALVAALSEGRLGATGLDVYEHEPRVHPGLIACESAVILPHLGSATIEARTAMGMQAADNLDAFFDRGKLLDPVG